MKPNLLVSFNPLHPERARTEILRLLREAGEPQARLLDSDVAGLAQVHVAGDPKAVIHSLHQVAKEMPEAFGETFRWIPVERYLRASKFQIKRAAKAMDKRISDSDEWAIRVAKRHSSLHSDQVTTIAAGLIHHPHVNLTNPQKEVRFEIVGRHMGVSLLAPDETLNVNDLRRSDAPEHAFS